MSSYSAHNQLGGYEHAPQKIKNDWICQQSQTW